MKYFYLSILALSFANTACQKNPEPSPSPQTQTEDESLQFEKEGTLRFYGKDGTKVIKTIQIELSDTPEEQEQGLMFRKTMPADTGMLFTFPNEEPRSFWMANTYLSLDIIYVNAKKEIVSIAKNATPLSEKSLPSEAPAQYVIEVPAGYTDTYSIEAGQKVDFQLK